MGLQGVQDNNDPTAKNEQISTLANVKTAAIPLRSVHHDVFYVPAKMPAAQELVYCQHAPGHMPSASLDEREQDERAHDRYEHS